MFEKILKIIEKYSFNKDLVKNAKPESKIIADLNINSTRIVDIILDVEEEFNIEVEDTMLEKLITVGDLQKYVESKIS